MKRNLLIIGFVTLMSSWTWSILSQNIFIGICCIFLSFLLLLNFNHEQLVLPQRFLKVGIICLWGILSIYLFTTSFDKDLFHISENQYINVLKRQEIYATEFNYFYRNRIGIYYFNIIDPFINRYFNNTSAVFDLENLFISSYDADQHKTRLPVIFLPFMAVGLFYLLRSFDKKYAYIIIIILVISGFVNSKNTLGLITFYPIIYASIGLALSKLLNKIR